MKKKKRTAKPVCVCVVSLGCAKNLVDTEVMCGSLAVNGFALVGDPEQADIMLINTCSFIFDARTEAEGEIQEALRWKRAGPNRHVVVAGCLPQRDLGAARRKHPGVDRFLGLDDVPQAGEILAELVRGGKGAELAKLDLPTYLYDDQTPRLQLTPSAYAYVKIAEGCNHFCRFCAIPHIRGRQRSRTIDSIVAECRQFLGQGVGELNLIAQDSTRYGEDLADGTNLAGLLRVLDALPGRFWIRVLYTHPRFWTDELMAVLANATHVVPYVDIPLQHIADPVLKAMGRQMGEAETRALMTRLRERVPGATIRSTFLVGYPGETDAHFESLRAFVESFRFDRLGVFAFSSEEGTPAAEIREGLVPPEVAAARRHTLMLIQQEISTQNNEALVGGTLTVLCEGPGEDAGEWLGRTPADGPEIDNQVHIRQRNGAGASEGFIRVKIDRAAPYDLWGRHVHD